MISGGIRQLMVCNRILCRIRNAGNSDQDNRNREQLRQDPLPEISSQDSQHRQRVSFPAATGTKTGRQSGRKDKQPGKRTPAAGTDQIRPDLNAGSGSRRVKNRGNRGVISAKTAPKSRKKPCKYSFCMVVPCIVLNNSV